MTRFMQLPVPLAVIALLGLLLAAASGCASFHSEDAIPPVSELNVERFMGDWYVIAAIPTFLDDDCQNPVESYRLREDGRIDNEFRCRLGGPGAEIREMDAVAWIVDQQTRADWKVRFFWPLTIPYRIFYVDTEYRYTAAGTPEGGYLWIMSRTRSMPEPVFTEIIALLDRHGVDTSQIVRMPHDS
jgi:apolipoprotein D and lipocalin family protein